MQKKLIVLALASAFAAPAFAATSNVDIYGQLDVSVDRVSGIQNQTSSGAGTGNSNTAWRLSSNTSRIGLKGSEDLGGGLAAIWQFEQAVNLDNGATSQRLGQPAQHLPGHERRLVQFWPVRMTPRTNCPPPAWTPLLIPRATTTPLSAASMASTLPTCVWATCWLISPPPLAA